MVMRLCDKWRIERMAAIALASICRDGAHLRGEFRSRRCRRGHRLAGVARRGGGPAS